MSLWSNFTDAISSRVVRPVKSFGKDLLTGNLEPIIDAPSAETAQSFKGKLQTGLRSVNEFGITGTEKSADLLLKGAACSLLFLGPPASTPINSTCFLS